MKMNRTTLAAIVLTAFFSISAATGKNDDRNRKGLQWVGTWATAAQPSLPATQSYNNQTLRLIVHASIGGSKVRIKISNTYADRPLVIGAAHIARRAAGANIEPASDRVIMFGGNISATIAAGSMVTSDPLDFDTPPLADLAISIFLPETTTVATVHHLAKQT